MELVKDPSFTLPSLVVTKRQTFCNLPSIENPSKFILTVAEKDNLDAFDSYIDNIEKEYERHLDKYAIRSLNALRLNLPVFYKLGVWMRGRVKEIKRNSNYAIIENMDDGKREKVHVSCIYFMSRKTNHQPVQRIYAKLHAIYPDNKKDGWSIEAINLFRSETLDKTFQVLFVSLKATDNCYSVYLRDPNDANFSIERRLLSLGGAHLIGHEIKLKEKNSPSQVPQFQFISLDEDEEEEGDGEEDMDISEIVEEIANIMLSSKNEEINIAIVENTKENDYVEEEEVVDVNDDDNNNVDDDDEIILPPPVDFADNLDVGVKEKIVEPPKSTISDVNEKIDPTKSSIVTNTMNPIEKTLIQQNTYVHHSYPQRPPPPPPRLAPPQMQNFPLRYRIPSPVPPPGFHPFPPAPPMMQHHAPQFQMHQFDYYNSMQNNANPYHPNNPAVVNGMVQAMMIQSFLNNPYGN